MAPEVEEMRRWLHAQLDVSVGGRVVDVGCGAGEDLRLLAQTKPQAASYVGIDRSEEWIVRAKESPAPSNMEFVCADASKGLPFDDGSVDSIYSVNLLECLPDKAAFVAECARALRPRGSIVVAHFDWDTQTFDGEDRTFVRKVVHAFNDWQQAWMEAIDPWAGRRLKRYFADEGPLVGEVRAHTLISSTFEPGSYGYRQAESFEALVRRGLVARDEYESFMRFLRETAERDAFFYSVTMFAFVGTKRLPADAR